MLGPSLLIIIAVAFQAPEPPPTKPLVTEAEARLRDLEHQTQLIRDEVRRELADAATLPEQAANQAKKAWDDAIVARKAAEGKVLAYTKGTLPQEIETKKGEIALAESDVERAEDQLAARQKAIDEGREIAGARSIVDKLTADRAGFELETAKTQLVVQERYHGPKETKRLEALVAAAADEEQIKKKEYEVQADRLKKRRAESARLQARTPEDLVVAILDDVVQRETRLVEFTRELAASPADGKLDPNLVAARRDAVANMARQIKEDLTLATTVAEEARQARDRLFKAEKRLIVARRDVDRGAK